MGAPSAINGYNNFGEQVSMASSALFNPLYSVNYTRDQLGRISSKQEVVQGVVRNYVYTYDLVGRLTDVTGAVTHHYSYDSNGNRLTGNGVNAVYDMQDRLVAYGDYQYSYSGHGRLAAKQKSDGSDKTIYVYDDFGQLASVTLPDGRLIEYLVGGENQRIVKKVNGQIERMFTYVGGNSIGAEHNPDGSVKSIFVYGESHSPEYMVQGTNYYRFIKDQLGSIRLVVDYTNGQVVQRLDYDEFGNVLQDTNPGFQPFGFAGGLYDSDTKLVRFGARDYDPEIGRWTAKDPILFGGGDTNLFGYTFGDPVNYVDADGKCPLCVAVTIGAGVGAAANLAGAYFGGYLNTRNFGTIALTGAVAGGAAVLTSGTAALATATTWTGLLTAPLGSALTGTLVGGGIDLSLTALLNSPPDVAHKQPKKSCP